MSKDNDIPTELDSTAQATQSPIQIMRTINEIASFLGPPPGGPRIKFVKDQELEGFDILCESGYPVDCYKDNFYRITSPEQLRLLKEAKIKFYTVTDIEASDNA